MYEHAVRLRNSLTPQSIKCGSHVIDRIGWLIILLSSERNRLVVHLRLLPLTQVSTLCEFVTCNYRLQLPTGVMLQLSSHPLLAVRSLAVTLVSITSLLTLIS
jgi:hypothetical protein